jgi:hypothetical protein
MDDFDGISILEDAPLPQPTDQYKSIFDGILQNMNIPVDPSRTVSICGDTSLAGRRKRKEWSRRSSIQVSPEKSECIFEKNEEKKEEKRDLPLPTFNQHTDKAEVIMKQEKPQVLAPVVTIKDDVSETSAIGAGGEVHIQKLDNALKEMFASMQQDS